ncbi:HAD family hydrolase [Jeotgalibacillus salarius]|uniref:HAD family hydrolase n=1 Tax=Jeotgalibacillus salarius TaxID=546023 RepID=A0A4Y8LHI7_9BACL|nr:HAD family hydrolase [Jeotgalibacillus salarius]TFE02262.1 HAD family hydrolase [Jeotgalibacillus salarius]
MDSIIFDLDGTLWDPRETVLTSWNKAIEDYPKVDKKLTLDDLKQTMGKQMHEISQIFFPELSEEDQKSVMDYLTEIEIPYVAKNGGELYPDLEDTLKDLSQKYRLFIVSNCQEGYIEAFYEYHGLDKYFDDFENPGRTGLSKGENIKLVIDRNGLQDSIYVGDTQGDRDAARKAGVPFVYAKYGFGEVNDFEYEIERLPDLKKHF